MEFEFDLSFDASLFKSIRQQQASPTPEPETPPPKEAVVKKWQKIKEAGFDISYELSEKGKTAQASRSRLTPAEMIALEREGLLNQTKTDTVLRAIEAKRFWAIPDTSAAHFSTVMVKEKGRGQGYGLRTIEKIWAIFNRLNA